MTMHLVQLMLLGVYTGVSYSMLTRAMKDLPPTDLSQAAQHVLAAIAWPIILAVVLFQYVMDEGD